MAEWIVKHGPIVDNETPEQRSEREAREAHEHLRIRIDGLLRERLGCEHRIWEAEELLNGARDKVERTRLEARIAEQGAGIRNVENPLRQEGYEPD